VNRAIQLIEAVGIMRQEMRSAFMSENDLLGIQLEQQIFILKEQIAFLGPAIAQIENKLYGLRSRKERRQK